MDDAPLDRELERVSGDPGIARAVKDSLRRLRDGAAGPDLAEMARELLEGRSSLRSLADSSAYSEPLTTATSTYQQWYRDLTPEQQRQLHEDTITHLTSRADE